MADIQIGHEYLKQDVELLESTCWMAREILGGYMGEAYQLAVDGNSPDGVSDGEIDDDEFDDGASRIWVHETAQLELNPRQYGSLSNIPYVFGDNGELIPVTEPGFVALRVEPIEDPAKAATAEVDGRTMQIVFQVPDPARMEDGAIYRGFSLDENDKLDPNNIRKVKQLGFVLTCMRNGFRQLVSSHPEYYQATYLSTVPTMPINDELIFEQLFGASD